jgi:hypothetical protein
MKRKVGKEPQKENKKRKEVGNDNSFLASHVCKCDTGMSVENVPAVVKIKTLKGRSTAHKFLRARGNRTVVLTLLSEFSRAPARPDSSYARPDLRVWHLLSLFSSRVLSKAVHKI